MDEFGEGAAFVGVLIRRESELVQRIIADVGGEEFFCKIITGDWHKNGIEVGFKVL